MKTSLLRAAGAVLLLGLAGCMAPAPYVDAHLGQAATDMRNAQIMNPAAGNNPMAPSGLDGPAAKAAYDRYQKSFKAPEPSTNTFTIGVGH